MRIPIPRTGQPARHTGEESLNHRAMLDAPLHTAHTGRIAASDESFVIDAPHLQFSRFRAEEPLFVFLFCDLYVSFSRRFLTFADHVTTSHHLERTRRRTCDSRRTFCFSSLCPSQASPARTLPVSRNRSLSPSDLSLRTHLPGLPDLAPYTIARGSAKGIPESRSEEEIVTKCERE